MIAAGWLALTSVFLAPQASVAPKFDGAAVVRAHDHRGRLNVFAVANDGSLWRFREPGDGEPWRIEPLGGRLAGPPAVTLGPNLRFQVWATAPDHGLLVNVQNAAGDGWMGWTRVKAPAAAGVVAAPRPQGRTALLLRGPDGQLHAGSWTASGTTQSWRTLPVRAEQDPQLLRSAGGAEQVVFVGRGGQLYAAGIEDRNAVRLAAPPVQRMALASLSDRDLVVASTARGLAALERSGGRWTEARILDGTAGFTEPGLALLNGRTAALIARGPNGTVEATWLSGGRSGPWLDTAIAARGGVTTWVGPNSRLAVLSTRLLDTLATGLTDFQLPRFRLRINRITPDPIVERDRVTVYYTLVNETAEEGTGGIKATFDGEELAPVGTPFAPPLPSGSSFGGTFTMGPFQHASAGPGQVRLAYTAGVKRVWTFPPELGIAPVEIQDLSQFAEARETVQVLAFADRFPTDDPPVTAGPFSCLATTAEQREGCGWGICGAGNTPETCPQDCPPIAAERRSYNSLDFCRTATGAVVVPHSIAEMQAAILAAKEAGQRVRLVGRFHSSNPLPCTEGVTISTAGLKGAAPVIGIAGDYCQRFDCTAKLDKAPNNDPVIETFDGVQTVRVGPGRNLFELAEYLDGQGLSLGFAFPGFREATVGGAVSTGTHGSSTVHPAVLSTRLKSLTIIGADGVVRELSSQTLPASTWEAARVGLGYLGAVVQLRLYVEPQFNLNVSVRWKQASDLVQPGAPHSMVAGCDFGEMVWFPSKGSDGAPVMVLCGTKTSEDGHTDNIVLFPDDAGDAGKADAAIELMQREACSGEQSCGMERTRADVLRYYKPPFTFKECGAGVATVVFNAPEELVGGWNDLFEALTFFTSGFLYIADEHTPDCETDKVGKSHRMVSSPLPEPRMRPLERDWEIYVPGGQAAAALQLAKAYFQQHEMCLPLIGIFIRFAPPEAGTLIAHTVAEGPTSATADPAGMFFEMPVFLPKGMRCADQARYEKLYSDLVDMLVAPPINGRGHWGKNRRSLFQLQRRLGTYGANMTMFREEVAKADPTGMFANQFGVDMGLRWPRMTTPVPADSHSDGCAP